MSSLLNSRTNQILLNHSQITVLQKYYLVIAAILLQSRSPPLRIPFGLALGTHQSKYGMNIGKMGSQSGLHGLRPLSDLFPGPQHVLSIQPVHQLEERNVMVNGLNISSLLWEAGNCAESISASTLSKSLSQRRLLPHTESPHKSETGPL